MVVGRPPERVILAANSEPDEFRLYTTNNTSLHGRLSSASSLLAAFGGYLIRPPNPRSFYISGLMRLLTLACASGRPIAMNGTAPRPRGFPVGTPRNRLTAEQRQTIIDMLKITPNGAAVTRQFIAAKYGTVTHPTVCTIKREAIEHGEIRRTPLRKEAW